MWKFFGGLVNTTFFLVIGVIVGLFIGFLGATPPAVASPQCMTQDEARKAFPRHHLYWHTLKHCWDNIGNKRNKAPAANNADAAYAEATQPEAEPASPSVSESATPPVNEPAEPVADWPAAAVVIPLIPFTGGEPARPVPDTPASGLQARMQVAAALPPAKTSVPPEDNVVVGAPGAAPGSPEYLLEHCCWPEPGTFATAKAEPLRHMALALGGASGLAIGLWLFVKRRRQPARRRIAVRFGIRDSATHAASAIATAAESAIAKATATATAMTASVLRSWSALRDRRAY